MAKAPGKAFVKFGDWDIAVSTSSEMSATIDRSLRGTLRFVALKAERMAVKFVEDQSLQWEPLSRQYMDRKAREGLSNKILIATSTYFQSITSKAEGFVAVAGVFKQVKTKDGESVANIAQVLEFGSIARNIPPRPLWTIVFKEMHKWLKDSQIFSRNVERAIKRRAGK